MEELSKIILYADQSTPGLDVHELQDYLGTMFNNLEILLRDSFFDYYLNYYSKSNHTPAPDTNQDSHSLNLAELARELANAKVRDITDPAKTIRPLKGEIEIEGRLLSDPTKNLPGIFYDGLKLHEICQALLPDPDTVWGTCHIIFTARLFGTFDKFDRRYHARVILCGYPSLLSTTGIVDAPAKPKEYYTIKEGLLRQGIGTVNEFMPEELRSRYLTYNDARLTEVMKGYVMQAVSYHLFGDPFCSEPECRLFNAHWQEELIRAQLTAPEFCEKHRKLFGSLNDGA